MSGAGMNELCCVYIRFDFIKHFNGYADANR